jgi:uncharacterized alkaline shock family protein YloU
VREVLTPEGRLVVSEAVVAAVARAAALRCPGVVATVAHGLPEGLRGLLFGEARDAWDAGAGVEAELDGDRLTVTVDVVVAFGSSVPHLAACVAREVARDLAEQVGLVPRRVFVRVQGVRRAARPPRADSPSGPAGLPPRGEDGAFA